MAVNGRQRASPSLVISAQGWIGLYLTIFPDKPLIAVRMCRALAADNESLTALYGYRQFSSNAFRLVPEAFAASVWGTAHTRRMFIATSSKRR
jgi:hypothetical protein